MSLSAPGARGGRPVRFTVGRYVKDQIGDEPSDGTRNANRVWSLFVTRKSPIEMMSIPINMSQAVMFDSVTQSPLMHTSFAANRVIGNVDRINHNAVREKSTRGE